MMKNKSRKSRSNFKTKRPIVTNTPAATLAHAHPAPPRSIAAVIQAKITTADQKRSAAALLERSPYQFESCRPIVCLLFVLPMIMAYELATILTGGPAQRSGVDQWLDYMLSGLGLGQMVLLPVVTAAALIVAHHRIDDHWRIRLTVLGGMLIEVIGLGLMLFWAANAFHLLWHPVDTTGFSPVQLDLVPEKWWANTMAMVGSGIYEELFFRLILLAPAMDYARRWTQSKQGAWIGIVAVSVLFAALHYDFINPAGASFEPSSFFFRFGASIVFSWLFLFRGFGIAVGTHVAFDVLTQL